MVDILHRFGAKAPTRHTYAALTTLEGLSGWWAEDVTGNPCPGGEIRFRFEYRDEPAGVLVMKVLELRPEQLVRWEVMEGPAEWIGTTVRFKLHNEDAHTIVDFAHGGWRESVEFMNHCSRRWGMFLMSLKDLVETGVGAPVANDVPAATGTSA